MFGITARDANFSGADLSRSMPIGDFKGANMSGATLVDLKGGADIKNQSMGLMRAVFASVNLVGREPEGGRPRPVPAGICQPEGRRPDRRGADGLGPVGGEPDRRHGHGRGLQERRRQRRPLVDLKGQAEAKDWAERVNADRAITRASD